MKTRLLVVLVFSSLFLATGIPVAFAQDAVVVGGGTAQGGDVQYVDCSQVQNAVQAQYGNAVADDEATAEVAGEFNISQDQVNACLGNIGANGDDNNDDANNNDENGNDGNNDDVNEASNPEDREDDVLASTVPKVASLPNTGGPSLLALGAGLALVAAGASLIGFSVRR